MTNIGIIGFGFMGRIHFGAYAQDARADVVAIADANPARVGHAKTGNLPGPPIDVERLGRARVLSDPLSLLRDPGIDAVSICVPTHLHAGLAVAALEHGKHVLVEKPVARTSAEGARIVTAAAARPDLACVPAMCIRYWPAWRWLKETVAAGTYGRVRSAVFSRLGAVPAWGDGFYQDPERSGGAILDLHIHDADFVRYCFGDPVTVEATGARGTTGGIDHVVTRYRIEGGPDLVVAEGGWMSAPGFPFSMRYRVDFERVTADFDGGRTPPVLLHSGAGKPEAIGIPAGDGYAAEIRDFLDCVDRGGASDVVTIGDGVEAVRLIEVEAASVAAGGPVAVAPRPS